MSQPFITSNQVEFPAPLAPVKAATVAQLASLSGPQTVDTVSLIAGDRVLVKNGTAANPNVNGASVDNGVYVVAAGAWTRAVDFDNSPTSEARSGDWVYVLGGSATNIETNWTIATPDPIVVGTTPIKFFQSGGGTGNFVPLTGATMTGSLDMSGNTVTDLATPSALTDAATKDYVDTGDEPAGLNTYIQYNDNGVVGADMDLIWNKTTKEFSVLASGSTVAGAPGKIHLESAASSTASTNAGDIEIWGGWAGAGGGAGGDVEVLAGGAAAGNGGSLDLGAGPGAGSNNVGGNVALYAGNSAGTGAGGYVLMNAGNGGATGTGGDFFISAGAGGGTSGDGGRLIFESGSATQGNGGAIELTARAGVGTNRNGGAMSITAGNATGTGTGGSVTIKTGVSPSGTSGSLVFQTGTTATTTALTLAPNGDATFAGDMIVTGATIPQNSQSAAYTFVASDANKHILHPSADTTARTFTIPSNASVPYKIGTAITIVNQDSAGVITIAITTDTMRLAGAGTTGSRTLAANGVATALKITATEWIISGTGLT